MNRELDALTGANNVADLDSNAEEELTPIQALNRELDIFNTADGAGAWAAEVDTNAVDVKALQVDPLTKAIEELSENSPYESEFIADTETAVSDIDQLKTLAEQTAGTYDIIYRVTTEGSPPAGAPEPPGRAMGGPVDPYTLYKVGERGPEYFMADQPGTIYPTLPAAAPSTVRQGDRYVIEQHFHGPTDRVDVKQAVEEVLRETTSRASALRRTRP